MIIIFEGVDKAGKTTLAKKISKEYNIKYFKSSHEIFSGIDLEESIKYDWLFMLDFLKQTDFNVIFDRSFISQFVYSLHYRYKNIEKHYNKLSDYFNVFAKYINILCSIPHIVIYCNRENYVVVKDEKILLNSRVINSLKNEYNSFFEIFTFNEFEYKLDLVKCKFEDGVNFNLNKIKKTLKHYIRRSN